MKEIYRFILDYVSHKWKSLIGFVFGIILILFIVNQLNIPAKPIVVPLAICFWIIFWVLKTGRLILPSRKKSVVFCIHTDDDSDKHYRKVLQKLRSEIDTIGASRFIQFIDVAAEIIKNKAQAEKYRETRGIDLVIWGNADTETSGGKTVINFRLNYTFKLTQIIITKLHLFSADLRLVVGAKKWIINTDNTLSEEIRVSHSFKEACLFIIGIYLLTENRVEESIVLLTELKMAMPDVQDDNFKILIQGRINSILVEAYLLVASEAIQKKDYEKALKYYLELSKYPVKRFRIFVNIARIEYYLGNLKEAQEYTFLAAKEEPRHPVIFSNYAFFRVLSRKYDDALIWYKKIYSLSHVDIDIPGFLEFLEERFSENNKEYAFLFALGLINYRFFDKAKGAADILKFISKTEGKSEYRKMNSFSKEVLEAEKYRKKITKKAPSSRA